MCVKPSRFWPFLAIFARAAIDARCLPSLPSLGALQQSASLHTGAMDTVKHPLDSMFPVAQAFAAFRNKEQDYRLAVAEAKNRISDMMDPFEVSWFPFLCYKHDPVKGTTPTSDQKRTLVQELMASYNITHTIHFERVPFYIEDYDDPDVVPHRVLVVPASYRGTAPEDFHFSSDHYLRPRLNRNIRYESKLCRLERIERFMSFVIEEAKKSPVPYSCESTHINDRVVQVEDLAAAGRL
jgi:hypothetical protein